MIWHGVYVSLKVLKFLQIMDVLWEWEFSCGDRNLRGEAILTIWTFCKVFLFEPSLFEHSLKSALVKECTKEYEGKIMVQEQWLQLKMAGWANFWCLDYWKNGSRHFYLWPLDKIIPKVLITPKQREISHSPWTGFYRMFVHKRTSRNIFEFITLGIY